MQGDGSHALKSISNLMQPDVIVHHRSLTLIAVLHSSLNESIVMKAVDGLLETSLQSLD